MSYKAKYGLRLHYLIQMLILVGTGVYCGGAHAQQVQTQLSQDSVKIGDPVRITLLISSTAEYPEIKLPDSDFFSGDLFELNRQRFKKSTYLDSIILDLQYFSVRDTILTGIPIQLYGNGRDTIITTSRIPLFFQSVLPDSATSGELRPIKPIFEFSRPAWHYGLFAGILLLIVLLLWLSWRRWKALESKEPELIRDLPPFPNPLETLSITIEGLASQVPRLAQEDFPPFYVELGNAIRSYMEDVYGVDALEMTSFEILRGLQAYHAHESLIKATRVVLREADQVKFAKFYPTQEMARHAVDMAREFYNVATREDRYRIEQLKSDYEASSKERLSNAHPLTAKETTR